MKTTVYCIIISLLLVGVSSCSTININNLENKLIKEDSNRIVFSITTTYLPSKTVWYYTNDSIIIYKKNKKNTIKCSYRLDDSPYHEQTCKSLDLEKVEKDIDNNHGFTLDGDMLTVTQVSGADVVQKTFYIDVSKFVKVSFETDFLNMIKKDITRFTLWPVL
ncbi:MAG: hypothetical protein IKW83_06960 [Muribaculaceae bacterium]|nr:hypothetical protein [Muribaculaceae bacterium]